MSKALIMGLVSVLAVVMVFSNTLPNMLYATNNGNSDCSERGFNPGCTPGQHKNEKSDKLLGNPHYECCGSDGKGDPHDETQFNPDKGDPHCPRSQPGCN
jgi:hypothetical protein